LCHRLAFAVRPSPSRFVVAFARALVQHHSVYKVGCCVCWCVPCLPSAPVAPVASPAAPLVAAVGPFAPTDAPTGTSSVGGSGGRTVWHGEQQLHVFRLPATVNGQAAAPLELDERDERVVRVLEEYSESAFCAD
ncbi:hypothetical protein KEM55_009192, partial [Ascosphaera atra]